ncbi:MAG: quinone oxidoreductase [Acidobacteria bacterium]|nr:quinone oxidoreductase [Acidobacteriota bacterium]
MKAIVVEQYGGDEVLQYRDVETPTPKAGEALVKLGAIGLNFIDVYHRTGLYPMALPFTPGSEGAGVVEALGAGVNGLAVGDRVAYASSPGSYAEYACVAAERLIKLPANIDESSAAAAMLQGMTAHYLVTSTYALKRGDSTLVHAAAGGVGLLLIQMAKQIGARVIGTVSTQAKAELAKDAGADEIILYTEQDFEAEVKRITDGKGVQVVYDSVGKTTFLKSLKCLAPRGMLALFGQSSGTVEPVNPALLAQQGSVFLTRPSLAHYSATRAELEWRAGEVLSWVASGELQLRIEKTFPLAEAAEAHRQLEGRKTTGKVLLIP